MNSWAKAGLSLGGAVALLGVGALLIAACSASSAPAPKAIAAPQARAASTEATTVLSVPATTTTPSTPPTITIAAVGDMLFDSAPKRLIQAKGANAPFAAVASRLRGADITIGNLECPLSKRGRAVAGKTFTFQGDPRAAAGLAWAGFDVVSLANNHAKDYGDAALLDTFTDLRGSGLAWAGAGVNHASAWKPTIVERGGARIAYLAFSEITPGNFAATSSKPGTAYTQDISAVVRAVKAAHKAADYVIVAFHWGVERSYAPTARQVHDGRAAIDAGADLVLSHHPHVLQGVEFYRRGLIAYSLGNFIFSPGNDSGRDSMILHASLGPAGVRSVTVDPVYIGRDGRTTPQVGAAARRILAIVSRTSRSRGTHTRIGATAAVLTP